MRQDMPKLLTEGGRSNQGLSRKWGKRIQFIPDYDYDDEIKGKAPIARRRQYGYNHKELTDVLGPLKGYLRKAVGRPWDEVYSEICSTLDRRSVTGLHVFSHLWQYVDLNCWIGQETGTVYTNGKRGIQSVDWFYVHPFTGLLAAIPKAEKRHHYRRDRKRHPVTEVPISTGKEYAWIDGIWYYTEFSWVTYYKDTPYYKGSHRAYRNRERDKVYTNKRQLNKKQLKALGLSNTRLALTS